MHLSISNSDKPRSYAANITQRDVVVFLLCMVACLLFLETIAAFGFRRVNHMYKAVLAEQSVAQTLGPQSILLVGNSTFMYGLDVPLLESGLTAPFLPRRYAVSATTYNDWYFGLRKLFKQGARPGVVIVGLTPTQITLPLPLADDSPMTLIDKADLREAARRTKLNATQSFTLMLSHYSSFFGHRAAIRQFFLQNTLPGYFEMSDRFFRTPAKDVKLPDEMSASELTASRLRELKQLCSQYNSELIYAMPPTNNINDKKLENAARDGADRAGVPTLMPIRNYELGDSYFSDGYHLNAVGAAKFTSALARDLVQVLRNRGLGPSPMAGQPQRTELSPSASKLAQK